MPQSPILLPDVNFVYQVVGVGRRARKPRTHIFMDGAPVEVRQADPSETKVAYSYKAKTSTGFDILLHDGRLYWPALMGLGGRRGSVEAQLRRLLSWRCDATGMAWHDMEPPSLSGIGWREILHSTNAEALALLHRRAESCLVVGGQLYALGGVPLVSRSTEPGARKYRILSTGTTRALHPAADGLGCQPGSFDAIDAQHYLATGDFDTPSLGNNVGGLTAHVELPVDPLETRLDATYRITWDHLQWPARNLKRAVFVQVVDQFTAAKSGSAAASLTERRYEALCAVRERMAELRLDAPLDHIVGSTLAAIEETGISPPDRKMTEEEIAALTLLAE
jgi:hypothetical protein